MAVTISRLPSTSPNDFFGAAPMVLYVDSVDGDDSNRGTTEARALQTIAAAFSKHGGSAKPLLLLVTAPSTAPLRESISWTSTPPLWIRSMTPGTPWYHSGSIQFTSGWSSVGAGVYSRTQASIDNSDAGFWVDTLDANSLWTRITENTSTPSTPSAGEFGSVGTTLYLHMPGSINPNGQTLEFAFLTYGISASTGGPVTVQECISRSAVNACFYCAAGGRMICLDCDAYYGGFFGGFATVTTFESFTAERCASFGARNDGFNIHGSTGNDSIAYLIDCTAAYNLDEGASPHDDTVLIVSGGRYHHNTSGGITGVNRARMELTSVEVDHNGGGDSGGLNAGINAADTTSGFSHACNVHDNNNEGFKIGASSTFLVDSDTVRGLSANNALADVGVKTNPALLLLTGNGSGAGENIDGAMTASLGGTVTYDTGYFAGSQAFVVESGDSIKVTPSGHLDLDVGSVLVWAKIPATANVDVFGVGDGSSGNDQILLITNNTSGEMRGIFKSNGGSTTGVVGDSPTPGTWALLYLGWSGTDVEISVNAGTKDTGTRGAIIGSVTGSLCVGTSNTGTNAHWVAPLGPFMTCNRLLTDAELDTVFARTTQWAFDMLLA